VAEPAPDRTGLSDAQRKEAVDRRSKLTEAWILLVQGCTLAVAASAAGLTQVKLCRLLQLATVSHDADPRTPLSASASHGDKAYFLIHGPLGRLAPGVSTGRTNEWEFLLGVKSFTDKLLTLYIATIGSSHDYLVGKRSAKVATALERMAEEPECPAALARKLRKGQQPVCFVRYLRKVTPEVEARIRGAKHLQLHGASSRRDQTARLPNGDRIKMISGFVVELDDMSINQPFWVNGPDGKPTLSRQGLYARCSYRGYWLGFELVARPREAYRAEDILRFLRRLMLTFGKFDSLRMEKGIWHARTIKGFDADGKEASVDRPAMADTERARLQQGLSAIGITIKYESSARGKGSLEKSFDYLQRITATYSTQFVNVGRHAGEFEKAAKAVRRARAESHHPANLGFARIDQLSECIEKAMRFVNARTVDRERSADEQWDLDMAQRPLPPLTERDMAAFLPDVREVTLRGLRATCKVDGKPHDFRAEYFARLGDNYRIWVRFDASEPQLGAAIYNRETGSANTEAFALGDFICWARWEMPGPLLQVANDHGLQSYTTQELYGVAQSDDDGLARRRALEKWVQTSFRALPRPGQPSVKAHTKRDGLGYVVEATAGQLGPQRRTTAEAKPAPRQEPAEAPQSFRLAQLLAEMATEEN
jgi:hypothetical protein